MTNVAAHAATTTSTGAPTHNIIEISKFALIYCGAPFIRFGPWPGHYVTYFTSPSLAFGLGCTVVLSGAALRILADTSDQVSVAHLPCLD